MKLLEDMSIKEMEDKIGFVDEPRRDLVGRSFTEKETILEREGIRLWPTGEATKIDTEEVVSLNEADRPPKAEPKEPEPVETKTDTAWGDAFSNNFAREAYGR